MLQPDLMPLRPQTRQRPLPTCNRVGFWKRRGGDGSEHLWSGSGATNVELLPRGIGADHQEIIAGADPTMARSSGQQRCVARLDFKLSPTRSAQHKTRRSGGEG